MIFLNESICDVEEKKQQVKPKYTYLYQFISQSLDSFKFNFILYTAGKFIQRCALIVTGEISKEFIGECWTYSISVLTKLQLKIVQVFYANFSFWV